MRLILILLCSTFAMSQMTYPPSRRDDVSETIHGVTVADPYRWLEDQQSPDTRAWIDAENTFTTGQIGQLPTRPYLEQRLGQLLKVDSKKVPFERNGRLFYLDRHADQDQYVLYMLRPGPNTLATPKVLVDPHPLAPDHSVSVSIEDISSDGTLVAYGIRHGGADELEIHFLDSDTAQQRADVLPVARYFKVAVTPDKTGCYYDIMTKAGPRVRWHKFGTDPGSDIEIFGSGLGPELISYSFLNEDGHYLYTQVLYGSSADKTEIYYLDHTSDAAKSGKAEMLPLIKTKPDQNMEARFFVVPGADHLYVHTNWRAPNGRILDIDMKHPARAHWNQIVDEQPNAVITNLTVSGGKLVVTYLRNVGSEIKLFTPEGMPAGEVTFPAIGTVTSVHGHWTGKQFYFGYSSFHIPETIYSYNVATKSKSQFARTNAPVRPDDFELKQVWYASKDGTKIPMFVLYKKGTKLDGTAPTFLTAYGGFNVSRTPEFSALAVVWAENGGVFALPNLRGGGEFGEAWHIAGMKEKKQNVFDDFIAAAEYLIANKYTSREKLSAQGGSNGGLLMGAMLTQRPDLFRAILCTYPLLDMVRYQDFLVARFWVPEYGSSEDPEQFKYIYKYSPYHNVHKGEKYPATLFMTGDGDTRVAPLHARKMTALMQWAQGGSDPILLHYDTKTGHSEGRSATKMIDDLTVELSFLWWQLGVTPTSASAGTHTSAPQPRKKPVMVVPK